MTPQFVHLHCHTEYSLIDSTIRIKPWVNAVKAANMPACAMTDHTNLFGLVKFYRAAQAAGIKPIAGADVWIYDNEEALYRLTLLCQNTMGYRHLTQLISRCYTKRHELGQPYLRREWLPGKTEGLIALSGAMKGDIGQALLNQRHEMAKQLLADWQQLFPQRFYLQLQRTGRVGEEDYIHAAVELAVATQTPVVATNDVCFLTEDDFEAHEVRVCIHDGYTLNDDKRPKNYSPQQYLRTPEEMAELFADIPEAIENTWYIAQRCNLELTLGKNFLPDFPIPAGQTTDDYFCEQARLGLEQRLHQLFDIKTPEFAEQRKVYDERLQFELNTILQMGFPGYFLIVADFIQWAKDNNIPVGPGRGSGAGSLVAYALKITDLDPLPYELLFERFLNPERVSMPDFDVDFCMEQRDDVIKYVARKYGKERVSQIITYGSMAAKAVVRDVGRVLGHPYPFVDQISKLIPFEIGITLQKALDGEETLKKRYEQEEEVQALLDMAMKLEGLTRNVGTHAGGVVISPSLLTDFSPLYWDGNEDSNIVTQFDKGDVEAVGLVKFDFLGLRTLTIIKWALEMLNRFRDEPLDITKIPLDDSETFNLLQRAYTTAVFQLESRGMKELIKRLKPDDFEEIIALMALFRPGPLQSGMVDDFVDRKHGRAPIEYPHPDLAPILKPTYGVILYQEQVMQIAQVLANYSLGGADLLRRAMGKKNPAEMAKQRSVFVEGATARGVDSKTADYIFSLMDKFSGYGFNKTVDKNTKIYTIEGIKSIEDCKAGDTVLTRTAQGHTVYSQVIALHDHGNVPLWEIEFDDGTLERCTLDHKWLTETGQEPLWKIIQMGSAVWGCAAHTTGNESSSKNLSRLRKHKKDIPLGCQMWCSATQATRYSCTPKNVPHLFEYDSYWADLGQRTHHVLWRSCSHTQKYQPTFKNLYGMSTGTTGDSGTNLQEPQTHARNACQIFLHSQENSSASRYTATTRRTFKAMARCSSRRISSNSGQSPRFSQTVQDGNVVRTAFNSIGIYTQCTNTLQGKTQTSRFCQPSTKNCHQSRRAVAFSTHQVGKTLAASTSAGSHVRSRNSTSILAINPAFDEMFQRQLWRTYLSRIDPTHKHHQRYQLGRDTVLRRPVRATFMGWHQGYDLEVDHPEHNFLLASGLCCSNSHSAAYALVSYQTAWLKTHHPAALMAAVMSADMDNTDKVVGLINECKAMKLTVLPPNVNSSEVSFTVADADMHTILYGLGAIKGAGEAALTGIVEARQTKGKFKDLFDFCKRIDLRKANRRVLDTLVKSGTLDDLGPSRSVMMASLDKAIKLAEQNTAAKNTGQNDFFGLGSPKTQEAEKPPFVFDVADWTEGETLGFEKDTLGFYLSGHPINQYLEELAQLTDCRLSKVRLTSNKQTTRVAGWVMDLRTTNSKRGRMANLTLEDNTARLEVTVYSDLYPNVKDLLAKDTLLIVSGEVREDKFTNSLSMIANQVQTLEEAKSNAARQLVLSVSAHQANQQLAEDLIKALQPYRADKCPVLIAYHHPKAHIELLLGPKWQVKVDNRLVDALQTLLGQESVKINYK